MNIGIINTGVSNIGSVSNMLKRIGVNAVMINNHHDLLHLNKIILPGVGAFDSGISKLESLNLINPIKSKASEGCHILGICLGMQMLATKSEEGTKNGLNLIPGLVKKLDKSINLPIPHIGWNRVKFNDNDLNRNLLDNKFYFVHSYYFNTDNNDHSIGITEYGVEFTSVVRRSNIYGVQFHPEKSHKCGLQMFKNFVEMKIS